MLHPMESPEKHQYNMETPPFLDKLPHFTLSLPFLAKCFFTPTLPPISMNFEKVKSPFKKGGKGSNYRRGDVFLKIFKRIIVIDLLSCQPASPFQYMKVRVDIYNRVLL